MAISLILDSLLAQSIWSLCMKQTNEIDNVDDVNCTK